MSDEITKAKIRRALLSGPDSVTKDATVAEMGPGREVEGVAPRNESMGLHPGEREHRRRRRYVR